MAFFYLKLIPPRPTFAFDMTEEERAVMGSHRAHMDTYFEEGKVLIFGPVLAPQGVYGMGVFEADTVEEVNAIMAADPSVLAGLSRFEVFPMHVGGAQGSRTQGLI